MIQKMRYARVESGYNQTGAARSRKAASPEAVMELLNRVLYEDIVSDVVIPAIDDSAMDSHAIIADDAHGASRGQPVKLQIIAEIQAGDRLSGEVSRGTVIRIMTGTRTPADADSVIQIENTEKEAGYVKIFPESVRYANCKRAGENNKYGR